VSESMSSQSLAAEAADSKEACLAAADQGQSLRDEGKYSAARDEFVSCAGNACPKLVHGQCSEWLRQVDEAIPTVVFIAKDDHGKNLSAVRVLLDGKLVAPSLDGKPLPFDPGPHDTRFERDVNESVTVHVILRTGEKNREVTATFPAAEGQTSSALEGMAPAPASSGGDTDASSFWNARTVTSLSLLAGGAVAVGLAVDFGLQSQSENNQAEKIKSALPSTSTCANASPTYEAACVNLRDTRAAQNRDAVLNEVLYVTGGALAAGAVATWFLWPKRQEEHPGTAWVAPIVGAAHAGVGVGGSF
jgi:hypothetical protein